MSAILAGCGYKAENKAQDFAHQSSDLPSDPDIIYGRLDNGLRYAVRRNDTPSKTASLLMRIETGSLNETEETRGLAHFLEHMAFNGSENIPENEMIKRLERFGLAFGADTNASTDFDETIYQLELPEVNDAIFDETLMIMRETADRLTLAPDAIERERGVILAEKRARNSPAFKSYLDSLEFYMGQTILPERLPIGTKATINSVTQDQFQSFYRGYYRPENTFITLVGDFETDYAIAKITEFFADWQGQGEALSSYRLKSIENPAPRYHYYQDPAIQTSIAVSVVHPYEDKPDTADYRFDGIIESLGNGMLNRRLGKLARSGDAKFIGASVGSSSLYDVAQLSSLNIRAEAADWQEAMAQSEQALRQALTYGFSQAELDEQLANLRKSLEVSVQTAPTRRTPSLARSINNAFSDDYVLTTPASALERYLAREGEITLEAVESRFKALWEDFGDRPQIYMSTPLEIDDAPEQLRKAFEASRAVEVAPRPEDNVKDFAYTDFGPAGAIRSQGYIDDVEVTTVEFENNVKLNIKKTDYETNVIRLRARIGMGSLTFPDKRGFASSIGTILNLSGLEAHKVDEIATIMAGKTVGANIQFGAEHMVMSGVTVPEDLDLQLNLMCAYLTAQAYREDPIAQWEKSVRSFYPTLDSTASGVARRDIPALIRSGNPRYIYPSEAELLDVDLALIQDWMQRHVKDAAIELSIVSDMDVERIIQAVARSFGALPKRAKAFTYIEPDAPILQLDFPESQELPFTLQHKGESNTALLRLYWPAPDGRDIIRNRKISMLAQLLEIRLIEELREEAGASYSPNAYAYSPRLFPDYGYMSVSLEVAPDDIEAVRETIKSVIAEFTRGDFDDALFARAMTPTLERIETSLESNSYWLTVIEAAQSHQRSLQYHRSRQDTYQNMTVESLKPLAASIFDPEKNITVQILPAEKGEK